MANEPKKVRQRRSMLQIPGVQTILSSLLCIVLGLLVGFVVLLLIDHGVSEKTGNLNAVDAILVIIKNFWKYGSSTAQMKYLGNTLVKTAPLLMCGLSVLFAYKVGLFNIGAAGQYVVGAGAALYCALAWNMPWYVCLLAAALAGALLACISGALKAFCNVNEVISCILLNWISLYAVNSLLSLVKDSNTPYTVKLSVGNPSALMPSLGLEKLFSNNRYVTIAIPLAIVIAVLIWVLLSKTKLGYELKATGLNKNAAKYCGMREKQNLILTMGIAGALAGIMVFGALGGALMMKYMPDGTAVVVVILLTTLMAMIFGMLYSLLLAVAAINFKADQTLVGTAMNLLGTAAATVIVKAINIAEDVSNVSSAITYINVKKAFLVDINGFEFNWFMLMAAMLLVISYVLLYKTRFGLRLQACGEHPQAADSVGINVYKMRYAGVMISGVLGGLGGLVYITAGVSEWKFENGVAGFGFLALAVMIFGQWKPLRIALAALLFGLFRSLSNVYTGFDFLAQLNLPSTFYNMLPYIISLLVLALTSSKSRAPKAEGIPYDKGSR